MFLNAVKLKTVRVSFTGYISFRRAVYSGTNTTDMWTCVPNGYFTLPIIPHYIQKSYHDAHAILLKALNPFLVFLKDPLGLYV